MGTINYGNQIQSIKFYDPADSDIFNRRDVGIHARGLYDGGLLTIVTDTQVTLSTLLCEIGDADNQLRVKTQVSVSVTVGVAIPYVILRWGYVAAVNNYMDVMAVALGSIQANDIIVGKCVFAGSTLTGFDYGERTIPVRFKEFLRVVPTQTPSMKVHVKGGWTSYGTNKLMVLEQDSSFTLVAPSVNPRIDYVYIDENGAVQVEQGVEAASPVAKNYKNRIVLAEIYLIVGQTSIVEDDITDVRSMVGSGGAGSAQKTAVQVSQTTHGFVVGDVLRWDSGSSSYVKALADSESNALALGVVSEVYDANSFEMTLLGKVEGLAGLVSGTLYYLSEATAGLLTATAPILSGQVSKPIFVANSTTTGYFINWRGLVLPFGGGGATKEVTQASHGFVVGEVLRLSGSTYVKAKADSAANSQVVGVVSVVLGVNNFTLMQLGYITGLSGLVAGTVYYLSPTTAGAVTATEPSTIGQISKQLLIADATSSGFFVNMRGLAVSASGQSNVFPFVNGDLVVGVLTLTHSLGNKYPLVQVVDNNDKSVDPVEITYVDTNSLTVDLTRYGVIAGTWRIIYSN